MGTNAILQILNFGIFYDEKSSKFLRYKVDISRNLRFSVTDLINRIVQVLRGDLYWVKISTRDTELIKLVEPWDEG